jgi:uncharacterized protein
MYILKTAQILALSLLFGLFASISTSATAGYAMDTPRTPAEIRQHGNHLLGESSLYLLQHAHNPLNWYPWSEEALEKARREDKPIFLSIGYSSCHWCHVMEHEVFEKDDVAAFMNENFICIKVDREERPDLDSVYMEAVQLMTGRGGWPMSVFLTPDLKPFYGGTYFPHDQFMDLVTQINEVYGSRRDDVLNQATELANRIATSTLPENFEAPGLAPELIEAATERGKSAFDQQNAGFSQSQKFPTPARWRFLLHQYRRTGHKELAGMITRTCDAMAGGGIRDHLAGGFHRYTVDPQWTVPHFEKMLYDNGQLASLFLEAGVVFDNPEYLEAGLEVLDFLLREMRDPDGGFYASFDADSGGVEGSYYVWNREEIEAVAGKKDGALLADLMGVSTHGNFEETGSSVLTMRADLKYTAKKHGVSREDLAVVFARHRQALLDARNKRVAPGLDKKIVTSWNGLVIAAMAQGYAVTSDEKYLSGGQKAADFLLSKHRTETGLLYRASNQGRLSATGILDDYAFLADGLMELYQVSGQIQYLQAAKELSDHVRSDFSREGGGFFMTATNVVAPLGRKVDYFDSVIPSGNAVMFGNLIKLSAITGETVYYNEAIAGLTAWSGLLERAGLEMAWWLDAASKTIVPFYDVVIAGNQSDPQTKELAGSIMAQMPANAVYSCVPAGGAGDDLLRIAPALAGKTAIQGRATAYVCEFGTCQNPTTSVEQMLEQLGLSVKP